MNRHTEKMVAQWEFFRLVPWPKNLKCFGVPVLKFIDDWVRMTRLLDLGTVISKRNREKYREKKMLSRREARREVKAYRESLEHVLTLAEEANYPLGEAVDAILISLGYHRHDRGEWRLRADSTIFLQFHHEVTAMIGNPMPEPQPDQPEANGIAPKTPATSPTPQSWSPPETIITPLIGPDAPCRSPVPTPAPAADATPSPTPASSPVPAPPGRDIEFKKLCAKARSGDAESAEQLRRVIRDRGLTEKLGDLGQQATQGLVQVAAGADPAKNAALAEKVDRLLAEVLGEEPSVLERLLGRRVINNWLAVYMLEAERAAKNPTGERLEIVEKLIRQAERRYQQSIHELARIRRLESPRVLARAAGEPER